MEPSGRNRWQLGGKWDAFENRLYGRSATGGDPRQPFELFGCHARAGGRLGAAVDIIRVSQNSRVQSK
jgi:hypothetical protein